MAPRVVSSTRARAPRGKVALPPISLAEFKIIVGSRHPEANSAYSAQEAKYRASYVNPENTPLGLDASLGLRRRRLTRGAGGPPLGEPINPGSLEPGELFDVPEEVVAYEWRVEQVGGAFRQTITKTRNDEKMWFAIALVPLAGRFQITLNVRRTNATTLSKTKPYRLQDFLVVSLGESLSAGQGNPDLKAIPTTSQAAKCEATTFKMLYDGVKNSDLGNAIIVGSGVDLAGQAVSDSVDFIVKLFGGDKDAQPARWQEPRAYRSYQSGPSLAAKELEVFSPTGATRITFLTFARSGAEINLGLINQRDGGRDKWIGVGEIEEARRTVASRRIDALIISIGGNDVGFAGSLTDLVKGDLLAWKPIGNDGKSRQEIIADANAKLTNELPAALEKLKKEIDSKLKPRRVYLLEYPTGLFEKTGRDGKVRDGGPCGALSGPDLDLDVDDGRNVKALAKSLNALNRQKAKKFGWIFVDGIEADFAGRGYCDSRHLWIQAEESCRNQGDFEGMMHPNAKGHEFYKQRIVKAVKKNTINALPIGRQVPTPRGVAARSRRSK